MNYTVKNGKNGLLCYITEYMIWYKNYISTKLLQKKKKKEEEATNTGMISRTVEEFQKDVRNHSIPSFLAPFISKKVKLRLRELNHLCYIDSKT